MNNIEQNKQKVLCLKGISKSYNPLPGEKVTVLDNVDLNLHKGEAVAILGKSGSGKSTLLHIAGLLDNPDKGCVEVLKKVADAKNSNDLRKSNIGFVYQNHYLIAECTALENVILPLLLQGERKEAAIKKAQKLLDLLEIGNKSSNMPGELSGGQQQRVAIARSMVCNPSIILADEPTGNLDPATAKLVFNLLLYLARDQGAGIIVATHSEEIANMADIRYIVRDKGLQKI